jgi:hypothetical protein
MGLLSKLNKAKNLIELTQFCRRQHSYLFDQISRPERDQPRAVDLAETRQRDSHNAIARKSLTNSYPHLYCNAADVGTSRSDHHHGHEFPRHVTGQEYHSALLVNMRPPDFTTVHSWLPIPRWRPSADDRACRWSQATPSVYGQSATATALTPLSFEDPPIRESGAPDDAEAVEEEAALYPHWYRNLLAHPDTVVEVGTDPVDLQETLIHFRRIVGPGARAEIGRLVEGHPKSLTLPLGRANRMAHATLS